MFGDLIESLIPRSEFGESTADIIQLRPHTVYQSVELVGQAIGAMFEDVQHRAERVETIAQVSDAVIDKSYVLLDEAAEKVRDMASDNLLHTDFKTTTQEIIAKNDAMAAAIAAEEARDAASDARVVSMEAYREKNRSVEERNDQAQSAEKARAMIETVTSATYEVLESDPQGPIRFESKQQPVARTDEQRTQADAARAKIQELMDKLAD